MAQLAVFNSSWIGVHRLFLYFSTKFCRNLFLIVRPPSHRMCRFKRSKAQSAWPPLLFCYSILSQARFFCHLSPFATIFFIHPIHIRFLFSFYLFRGVIRSSSRKEYIYIGGAGLQWNTNHFEHKKTKKNEQRVFTKQFHGFLTFSHSFWLVDQRQHTTHGSIFKSRPDWIGRGTRPGRHFSLVFSVFQLFLCFFFFFKYIIVDGAGLPPILSHI